MKKDHFNDPNAPVANRLWPVVNVAVHDEAGRLLLIERSDDGYWALPGGMVDVGESFTAAAVREESEESGYEIEVTGLVGLYSDPGHVTSYDDGTVSQECSLVFSGRVCSGRAEGGAESRAVGFVPVQEMSAVRGCRATSDRAVVPWHARFQRCRQSPTLRVDSILRLEPHTPDPTRFPIEGSPTVSQPVERRPAEECTPARYLGIRIVIFVPAPTPVSMTSP
jgi:ADP-ribose pyrophosphatase YjhB (NUDIX family)